MMIDIIIPNTLLLAKRWSRTAQETIREMLSFWSTCFLSLFLTVSCPRNLDRSWISSDYYFGFSTLFNDTQLPSILSQLTLSFLILMIAKFYESARNRALTMLAALSLLCRLMLCNRKGGWLGAFSNGCVQGEFYHPLGKKRTAKGVLLLHASPLGIFNYKLFRCAFIIVLTSTLNPDQKTTLCRLSGDLTHANVVRETWTI